MQKFTRLYDYIHEYQNLVYNVYSKNAVAFLCTYYSLSGNETVWDNRDLMGGAYEKVGDLSGIKWNKVLLLPVFFIEDINTSFDASETGYIKENETSIVIPSTYGITPLANDIIKLEQEYLRPNNDTYPIFTVTGAEIGPNTDKRFWKLKIGTEQSRTIDDLENQVISTYSFFDYDKKIHTLEDSQSLARLLVKSETIRTNLKSKLDQNSGFYFF